MRLLITSILLSILFSSCSLKTTEGLRLVPTLHKTITNPYFASVATDYVYKAKINIYGKNLGGILVVKKLGAETHRVVFTTEFGGKIFDFLFEGDTFTKNYALEDIDKKLVIGVLEQDFRTLIKEQIVVEKQYLSDESKVYQTVVEKGFKFYFFTSSDNVLTSIKSTSKHKEKFEILFTSIASEKHKTADKIDIIHENIKLKIHLDYLKNN